MTANKRIAYNVLATYGRSLLTLVCGLFTGRWLLMSLGEVDYGLFGVVGGLITFVSFLNGEMANAVGRYYAVAVGEASKPGYEAEGLEGCRRWFNTALMIHSILPLVLLIIGYPIGEWAVRCFLTIPPDRVEACVWVWRYTCVSSYFAMSTVPLIAMYTAKQYIAEMTFYTIAQTVINVVMLYYMVSHPGDWLARYALWMLLLNTTPKLIMGYRAFKVFPECRFNWAYWWDGARFKELTAYAALRLWGSVSWIIQNQGTTILVNKYLGAARNAAMTVGQTVASHTTMFASSLNGALTPALMNAYGAGDMARARTLAYQICKLGSLMVLAFALPVALEVDELVTLWLKNPPQYASAISLCVMAAILIEQCTNGFADMIYARGKIGVYQGCIAVDCLLTFLVCGILIYAGLGVVGAALSLVFMKVFICGVRLSFAWRLKFLSPLHWLLKIFIPLVVLVAVAGGAGHVVSYLMSASFLRVCVTTAVTEPVFILLAWFVVLDAHERTYVVGQLRRKLGLSKRGNVA